MNWSSSGVWGLGLKRLITLDTERKIIESLSYSEYE